MATAMWCGEAPARADPAPWLSRVGIEAWISRLADPAPAVRRGALWDLARHAPAQASPASAVVPAVTDLLSRETELSVLLAAVAVLATERHAGSERALQNIVGNARSGQYPPEVQAAAARALGVAGNQSSIPVLLRAATIGGAEVSDAAARALAELPDAVFSLALTRGRQSPSELAAMLRAVALRGDPRWGAVVLEALHGPPRWGTAVALEAAASLRLVEAAPRVAELATTDAVPALRRVVTRALGSLGGGFDPAVLRARLADPVTRDVALEVCGTLGDASQVHDLLPWLAAPWSADRRAAAEALAASGAVAALDPLAARAREESDAPTRRAMYRALARIGGPVAARHLASAVGDAAARWALVELAWRGGALPRGLRVPGADASARVLRGCAGGAPDRAGLEATSADTRLATALALREARVDDAALAARLWREDDEGVRVALVQALAASATPLARGALRLLLEREAESPTLAAIVAADAAGALGMSEAAAPLRRLLAAPLAAQRAMAARALGALGDGVAEGVLAQALAFETDAHARGAAALALAAIAGLRAEPSLRAAAATAWRADLDEMLVRARGIAREGIPAGRFEGAAVVALSGAAPRSVWAVALPDGGWALGVATDDGEVLIPGAPSADSAMQRLDGPP